MKVKDRIRLRQYLKCLIASLVLSIVPTPIFSTKSRPSINTLSFICSRNTHKYGGHRIINIQRPDVDKDVVYTSGIRAKRDAMTEDYNTDDIIILEGLTAVRKRPGMYIGNTGERGVHQLLFEVLDNSVDEYLAGVCNKINVTIHADGSVTISDNGRGIPCEISPMNNKSGLETVLTVLHSGGKFFDITDAQSDGTPSDAVLRGPFKRRMATKTPYDYSSGLHGVGLSVVNALSERLVVDVYRGDKKFHMELSKGKVVQPLTSSEAFKQFGTSITFIPDYTDIFKIHHHHVKDAECNGCIEAYNLENIKNRVNELAFLNPGLYIKLTDERLLDEHGNCWERTYYSKGGTKAFLQELIQGQTPLYKPTNVITIRGKGENVEVEASFTWLSEMYTTNIKAYANNVNTVGGTHIDGFKAAITRSVNLCLRKNGYFKGKVTPLTGEFIREGMVAILSIKLPGAEFDGQTKTKLGNTIAKTIIERVISSQLIDILDHHPQLLLSIHNKSQAAKKAYDAGRAARELIRQKAANILTSGITAKLSDCTSKDPNVTEIFIVEGESAAGNAKQARNRQYQAVLPLRGKILNIEKISNNLRVIENDEIKLLVASLGLTVDPTTWRNKILSRLDMDDLMGDDKANINEQEDLRYGKIILLTDADVDGAHLRILLLGLLFRLCPKLYENGHVFIACPPLYRISELRKKNSPYIYAWSDEELSKLLKSYKKGVPSNVMSWSSKNHSVQRFKGLGEMMSQQLWETTMDPERRILNKITVSDAQKASDLLGLLMGGNIQSRKEYIFNNSDAFQLQDLDI